MRSVLTEALPALAEPALHSGGLVVLACLSSSAPAPVVQQVAVLLQALLAQLESSELQVRGEAYDLSCLLHTCLCQTYEVAAELHCRVCSALLHL